MEERKIFDPQFVHCMWDDSLEGKRCIVSDNIDIMIDAVDNGTYHTAVINRSKGGGYALHSNETGLDYVVAYYDPLYDVKWAWKQGKQIQVRSKGSTRNEWMNMDPIGWFDTYEYRVKSNKVWRPFKSIEELKDTWYKRVVDCELIPFIEPMIWVRSKSNTTSTYLITQFCGNVGVVHIFGSMDTSLEQLFDDYTFLDGTPCGVEE